MILVSMKMGIRLEAPAAGVVEGDSVAEGQVVAALQQA
jgi:biotin carboxyl carrier protein